MPCFLLTFGDASRPPVGAVIIEAPSIVRDANGQTPVYVYSRDNEAEALPAKVLTKGEARAASSWSASARLELSRGQPIGRFGASGQLSAC